MKLNGASVMHISRSDSPNSEKLPYICNSCFAYLYFVKHANKLIYFVDLRVIRSMLVALKVAS